jgi:hypothetical protein
VAYHALLDAAASNFERCVACDEIIVNRLGHS